MHLIYELEVFDELITEDLHFKKLIARKTPVTDSRLTIWLNKAFAEKKKARKRFKPVTYSFSEEKHRQLYIRQHQSALVRLLDTLYDYLSPADTSGMTERNTDTHIEKLYKRLYAYCLRLLNYLQDSFPEYFNTDQRLPDFELLKLQAGWKERLPGIQKRLVRLKLDKKLSKLLVTKLNYYCDFTGGFIISYRTKDYISELFTSLEKLSGPNDLEGIHHPLVCLLISLNYNETDFKDYLAEEICLRVNDTRTVKEKIDKLCFYYKEFGNMHGVPGSILYRGIASVKDDMRTWLAAEIKYLEKSENLGIIMPARFTDDPQYKRGIWYNYTIQELALMQRVQHEAGYITNSNIVGMMEDLSKIAHTATQHNISYKNLKNLFYNIETDTIDSLHNKLLLLIRKLQDIKAGIIKKEKEKRTSKK